MNAHSPRLASHLRFRLLSWLVLAMPLSLVGACTNVGASCTINGDCSTLLCFNGVCVTSCDGPDDVDGCPDGYTCTPYRNTSGADPTAVAGYACVR